MRGRLVHMLEAAGRVAFYSATASIAAFMLAPSSAVAQRVLKDAITGYWEVCLASAPDFASLGRNAGRGGFRSDDCLIALPNGVARIEIERTRKGCACITTLIAPDPNATAMAVIDESVEAARSVEPHPDRKIATVLHWKNGSNTLQVESDVRGSVPIVRAYPLTNSTCSGS